MKRKSYSDPNNSIDMYLAECEAANNAVKENKFLGSMIYGYVWRLTPESTPRIIRVCPRCDKDRFYSSDMFRLNANQKKLDAWLIYKCISCDYTHNFSIARRIPTTKIDPELHDKLTDNDEDLAWSYAFDVPRLDRHTLLDWNIELRTETFLNTTKYSIVDLVNKENILVYCKYNLKISIDKFIRDKTKIARSKLKQLHSDNDFKLFNLAGTSLELSSYINKGFIIVSDKSIFSN